MRTACVISLLVCLSGAAAHAQGIIVPEHVLDSAAHVVPVGSPLRFGQTRINIGEVKEDAAPVPVSFGFVNAGDAPVSITKVTSSCGCVSVLYGQEPVAPGGKGSVGAVFHPLGRIGLQERTIYVYTDRSASSPAAVLSLIVTVLPGAMPSGFNVKMGPLACKRCNVEFILSGHEVRSVERSACMNTGKEALSLGVLPGFCPSWLRFRTEPEVIAPGCEGDIVLTLERSSLPAVEGSAAVLMDGIDVKPSQRTLTVKYKILN